MEDESWKLRGVECRAVRILCSDAGFCKAVTRVLRHTFLVRSVIASFMACLKAFHFYSVLANCKMACRQWGPFLPYPCPSPCPSPCPVLGPTGPTGPSAPLRTAPTSWFQAVLNATTATVALPTTATLLSTPWVVSAGNSDAAFQTTTGSYTAPTAGVYEVSFAGSITNPTGAPISSSVVLAIYVNGISIVNSTQSGAYAAAAVAAAGVSGIVSLNSGDVVQIFVSSTLAGLAFTSAVYPASAPSFLNIKSLV